MKTKPKQTSASGAPPHLREETARWYSTVVSEWDLEEHHRRILQVAAECWDRAQGAREVLDREGTTYLDRFQAPHARPEVKIEMDARVGFLRAVRELDLDLQEPGPPGPRRPPALKSNRRPGDAV